VPARGPRFRWRLWVSRDFTDLLRTIDDTPELVILPNS
jgi:hypothetical protein